MLQKRTKTSNITLITVNGISMKVFKAWELPKCPGPFFENIKDGACRHYTHSGRRFQAIMALLSHVLRVTIKV